MGDDRHFCIPVAVRHLFRVATNIDWLAFCLTVNSFLCRRCHGFRSSAAATHVAAWLIAATVWYSFPSTVRAVEANTANNDFQCSSDVKYFTFDKNDTSRSFVFRATRPNFAFNCTVYVKVVVDKSQQQLTLLTIRTLRLEAGHGLCDIGYNVSLSYNKSVMDVCQVTRSGELTFWSGVPFFLKLGQTSRLNNTGSILVHLTTATGSINICSFDNGSNSLIVHRSLYVFSSNVGMQRMPPNDVLCQFSNYTVTMRAACASCMLNVSVLGAPPTTSCWVLKANSTLLTSGYKVTVEPGSNYALHYDKCRKSNCTCSPSSMFAGFTIKAEAWGCNSGAGEKNASSSYVLKSRRGESNPSSTPMANMPVAICPVSEDAGLHPPMLTATECSSEGIGSTATSSQSESHSLTVTQNVIVAVVGSIVAILVAALFATLAAVLIVRRRRHRHRVLKQEVSAGEVTASVSRQTNTLALHDEIPLFENNLYNTAILT